MERTIDIINAHKADAACVWNKESQNHMDNWPWIKYSMQIALKVRGRMKELNLTQATLANKIGCSQQYISLLLKGKENLTLETIAKLESALDIQLFGSTSAYVNGYSVPRATPQYLSDSHCEKQ